MSHPLIQQIDRVTVRARRLVLLRSMGYLLAIVCLAAMAFATVDYSLRLEDRGTRWLITLSFVLLSGLAVWCWLVPLLRMRPDSDGVARMLERNFPNLQDRLSSAVAFLRQTEEESPYGSKALMRNLISQTTSDVESLNLEGALDARPMRRSLVALVGVLMVGTLTVAANPPLSSLAARRLLLPWQESPWPRMHNLRFVDLPRRVARGSDLLFVVADAAGRPPRRVDLQFMEGDRQRVTETWPMAPRGEKFVFERKKMTRSFRYRAVGGDDTTMPWSEIQVVEPPSVVTGQTELVPPAYTGWLPQALDQSAGGLRVFEGTEVVLSGVADRALSGVQLRYEMKDDSMSFDQAIEDGGKRYRVPGDSEAWRIDQPGEYRLELIGADKTKTVAPERWNVRVVRDQSPTITVLDSVTEDWITAQAVIRLNFEAEDDLKIKRVDLRFMRSDGSDVGEIIETLFKGPERLAASAVPPELNLSGDRQTITYDWSLNDLGLSEGTVVSYYVSAEDYKGQRVQRPSRRLAVISEQELIDRVARRHSVILARMQKRLDQQRQAKQHVEAVRSRFTETDRMEKPAMDRLQSALLVQRQVNSALAGTDAPVVTELTGLRQVLERSRIADGKTQQSVTNTLEALQQLAEMHLRPALDATSDSQQTLQASLDEGKSQPSPDAMRLLEDALSHQNSAIQSLENLLDEMSSWDNYRRIAQEINELLRQQNELRTQTQAVARQTLSRVTSELDGEQRAAMRSAASRQLDLARRMERTLANLRQAQDKLKETDPASEQMLLDAMQSAQDRAVAGRMRQAGKMIGEDRLGRAADEQAAASRGLEEMLDQLSRRGYNAKESEPRLDEADRELQRLKNRQRLLSLDLDKASSETNTPGRGRELQRLSKRQQAQLQEMRKLQRQLQRLRAHQASAQMGQAESSAGEVVAAAEQGSALEAMEKSKLVEAQLEQAQQQLQERLEQVRSQLIAEQMTKLPQQMEAVLHRQQAVNGEIVRLDELRNSRGEWTEGMRASVSVAAETERTLAADAVDLSTMVAQLPAYAFILQEIALSMSEVAEALEEEVTAQSTQALGQQVAAELQLMLDTMKNEPSAAPADAGAGQGGASPSNGSNGGEEFEPSLAQLKLLRELQQRINEETTRLNLTRAVDSAASKAIDQKVRRIAERQGRLAELVSTLYRPAEEKPFSMPAENRKTTDLDDLDQQLDLLLQ